MKLTSQQSTDPEIIVWGYFANALEALDLEKERCVHEDLITNLIWNAIAYLPGVANALGIPQGQSWHRGGRGEADMVSELRKFQIEVKNRGTHISYGKSCPTGCNTYRSQFEHIAEVVAVQLVVIAHRKETEMVRMALDNIPELKDSKIVTFTDAANMIRRSLRDSAPKTSNAIASFFNVETRESSAN